MNPSPASLRFAPSLRNAAPTRAAASCRPIASPWPYPRAESLRRPYQAPKRPADVPRGGGSGGRCDEHIGRFCIWHEDEEPLKLVAGFLRERGVANQPVGFEETDTLTTVNLVYGLK